MENGIQVSQMIYGNALMSIITGKYYQRRAEAHLKLFITKLV